MRLPLINGWQVRDKRLAAYVSLYFECMQQVGSPDGRGMRRHRAAYDILSKITERVTDEDCCYTVAVDPDATHELMVLQMCCGCFQAVTLDLTQMQSAWAGWLQYSVMRRACSEELKGSANADECRPSVHAMGAMLCACAQRLCFIETLCTYSQLQLWRVVVFKGSLVCIPACAILVNFAHMNKLPSFWHVDMVIT